MPDSHFSARRRIPASTSAQVRRVMWRHPLAERHARFLIAAPGAARILLKCPVVLQTLWRGYISRVAPEIPGVANAIRDPLLFLPARRGRYVDRSALALPAYRCEENIQGSKRISRADFRRCNTGSLDPVGRGSWVLYPALDYFPPLARPHLPDCGSRPDSPLLIPAHRCARRILWPARLCADADFRRGAFCFRIPRPSIYRAILECRKPTNQTQRLPEYLP